MVSLFKHQCFGHMVSILPINKDFMLYAMKLMYHMKEYRFIQSQTGCLGTDTLSYGF